MNLLSNLTKQRTLSFNKNGLKLHITKTYILSAYVFFFFFSESIFWSRSITESSDNEGRLVFFFLFFPLVRGKSSCWWVHSAETTIVLVWFQSLHWTLILVYGNLEHSWFTAFLQKDAHTTLSKQNVTFSWTHVKHLWHANAGRAINEPVLLVRLFHLNFVRL